MDAGRGSSPSGFFLFRLRFRLFLFGLVRRYKDGYVSSLLCRRLVTASEFGASGDEPLKDLISARLMLDLATLELYDNAHLISAL